mmetsp:Transcript_47790/g.152466  ORF Transcript_47790/g.152466 Transcript_47790/m.152466 type:complete len:200 (-) Transcript_47790:644-1243(-)
MVDNAREQLGHALAAPRLRDGGVAGAVGDSARRRPRLADVLEQLSPRRLQEADVGRGHAARPRLRPPGRGRPRGLHRPRGRELPRRPEAARRGEPRRCSWRRGAWPWRCGPLRRRDPRGRGLERRHGGHGLGPHRGGCGDSGAGSQTAAADRGAASHGRATAAARRQVRVVARPRLRAAGPRPRSGHSPRQPRSHGHQA